MNKHEEKEKRKENVKHSSSGNARKESVPFFDGSSLSYIGLILVIASVFAVGLVVGKVTAGTNGTSEVFQIVGAKDGGSVTELDFDLFWEVWDTVKSGHVDDTITDEMLYYGSIKGVAASTGDPVTVFLTPEETDQYNEGNAGVFEGIGAELGYEDGLLVVVAPLEGSPAQDAGLRPGDRILEVDGEDIVGENIYKVVAMIRGDAGTTVELTVIPEGSSTPETVSIIRGEITVPSISMEELEGNIVKIDVDRFTESSISAWQNLWDDIVEEAVSSNPEGVILDLRGNPGGYFNAAVWAAGDFLPEGSLIAEQYGRDGKVAEFKVNREGNLLDVPMVVLVDQSSASASEILAGALQFHGRATVIGEPTYGKGTAQQVVDYPDGSSLHITTLKWVLPDGRHLDEEHVIQPDQEVAYTEDDFKNGDDPQVDAALSYLN